MSERVCRPCDRKIRNGTKLHEFLEKAVLATQTDDVYHKEDANRNKRQLPTTITPERSKGKKQLAELSREETQTSTLCKQCLMTISYKSEATWFSASELHVIEIECDENDVDITSVTKGTVGCICKSKCLIVEVSSI